MEPNKSPSLSNDKGAKQNKSKKPIHKRWWFWVIIVVLIGNILGGNVENDTNKEVDKTNTKSEEIQLSESEKELKKQQDKEEKELQKQQEKEQKERLKEEQAIKDKEEFIASAQTYDYSEIERNPDEHKGKPAVFKGKVIQVSEGPLNTVIYRVATKNEIDDIVYITYKRPDGDPRVLENDIVAIYGDLDGVTTYTSVLAGKITIPAIKARYIIINE